MQYVDTHAPSKQCTAPQRIVDRALWNQAMRWFALDCSIYTLPTPSTAWHYQCLPLPWRWYTFSGQWHWKRRYSLRVVTTTASDLFILCEINHIQLPLFLMILSSVFSLKANVKPQYLHHSWTPSLTTWWFHHLLIPDEFKNLCRIWVWLKPTATASLDK